MNTLLDIGITPQQRDLLATIAHPWLGGGHWPVWGSVQHHFDRQEVDADDLFHSLPRVGADVPYAAGYGFTVPMRAPINPRDEVRLTVAASLVLPEMRMMDGEPFVRVLEYMVDLYMSNPVVHRNVPVAMMRSGELAAALPALRPGFIRALPELLSNEPTLSSSGSGGAEGAWEREVNRSVLPYRGVRTVEAYVAKTCEIVTATAAQFAPTPVVEEEPMPTAVPARGPYIDDALLDDLGKAAQTTTWNLDRLIALCRELNHNYTADMPHASAAMVRTILDHIPPVFQHRDFKSVAAQHSFGQTDKVYARDLVSSKSVGDDALHRQISTSSTVLVMDDIPGPVRLRAMLRELLTLL